MRFAQVCAFMCVCTYMHPVFPCRCHSLSRSTIERYGEGCSLRFSFRRLFSILVAVGGGDGEARGEEAVEEEEEGDEEGKRV